MINLQQFVSNTSRVSTSCQLAGHDAVSGVIANVISEIGDLDSAEVGRQSEA